MADPWAQYYAAMGTTQEGYSAAWAQYYAAAGGAEHPYQDPYQEQWAAYYAQMAQQSQQPAVQAQEDEQQQQQLQQEEAEQETQKQQQQQQQQQQLEEQQRQQEEYYQQCQAQQQRQMDEYRAQQEQQHNAYQQQWAAYYGAMQTCNGAPSTAQTPSPQQRSSGSCYNNWSNYYNQYGGPTAGGYGAGAYAQPSGQVVPNAFGSGDGACAPNSVSAAQAALQSSAQAIAKRAAAAATAAAVAGAPGTRGVASPANAAGAAAARNGSSRFNVSASSPRSFNAQNPQSPHGSQHAQASQHAQTTQSSHQSGQSAYSRCPTQQPSVTSQQGVRFSMRAAPSKPAVAPASASTATDDAWPPGLRRWVERAFAQCKNDLERGYVEERLRVTISSASLASKDIWDKDWDREPLPPRKKQEMWLPPISKLSKSESLDGERSPALSGGKSPSKRKLKSPKGITKSRSYDPEEQSKRARRADRFEKTGIPLADRVSGDRWAGSSGGFAMATAETEGDVELDFTVVGTCQVLEKKYLRLTSAPDPRTVRPEPVLRKTIELIRAKMDNFTEDADQAQAQYIYLWEQLKSVRQDLTVQRIRNDFTVEVYEMHARICLEYDDQHELKQCQAQLTQLYEEGLGTQAGQREFMAYSILYNLGKMAANNVNDLMMGLTADDKQDAFIAHALKVREASALGNYVLFFRLYSAAPGHSQFVMDTFVERERFGALRKMCRVYMPSVPAAFAARQLAFEDESDGVHWMRDHGSLVSADGMLDCKQSRALLVEHSISRKLEEERKEAQRKAEIVPISFA